jgi:hypothetical protein
MYSRPLELFTEIAPVDDSLGMLSRVAVVDVIIAGGHLVGMVSG